MKLFAHLGLGEIWNESVAYFYSGVTKSQLSKWATAVFVMRELILVVLFTLYWIATKDTILLYFSGEKFSNISNSTDNLQIIPICGVKPYVWTLSLRYASLQPDWFSNLKSGYPQALSHAIFDNVIQRYLAHCL